ncbi:uncharacterized protein MYCFIDRAFT_212080 [Pseudocercospora fijiensis CIRAD86]|uniref:Uncharacterized protein n=1 Tax=Pseudocercospora fijiensis (strain CIRAD86) TaxID=383855 RepID=M2ZN81_PSEFD|nr:uncharacterized protein MYCFIDRAFT_212080 [Pseudocercospora fijiensis CIRAD86]EME80559.1 hypothetical protein MYCFIDRAFT_212080 [Pseudocercospora fijiensis CIRAD86]
MVRCCGRLRKDATLAESSTRSSSFCAILKEVVDVAAQERREELELGGSHTPSAQTVTSKD